MVLDDESYTPVDFLTSATVRTTTIETTTVAQAEETNSEVPVVEVSPFKRKTKSRAKSPFPPKIHPLMTLRSTLRLPLRDEILDLNVAFEQFAEEESPKVGHTKKKSRGVEKSKRSSGKGTSRKKRRIGIRGMRLHAATFLQHGKKPKRTKPRTPSRPEFITKPEAELGGLSSQAVVDMFDRLREIWRHFRANQLKPDANVWVNFLRHSIAPTTHQTYVSMDRMLLLYCLMQGKSINFGQIILKSLMGSVGAARGGMYFAGMLTKMLVQKGVPQYNNDQIVKEAKGKWKIDLKLVSRLRESRQGGAQAYAPTMLQDLMAQNNQLLEGLQTQKNEFMDKIDNLKTDLAEKLKAEGEKNMEEME
ncbi:hypothetical protein L6452_14814 [Arctium lappa]|uniref:Uncharacterized protein n=1 Tax=Arctium lappa TaxID=4217 RepID=A0ACB9CM30_ARCLA|nr:hypothetical protein L6452_14814 [Arctium lappa]